MSTPAQDGDLLGQTLGSYELTGVLGRGSLGVVYSARHVQLGGLSACKVLHSEVARDHALVDRFLTEVRRATLVRHPNVIDIFDIGELPDGRIYYVMEQLSGHPLADVLRAGRLPFSEVVEIGRQLCEGLAASHAAGVIQHDLQLSSIYLTSRPGEPPLVKLADFGLTRIAELSRRQAFGLGRRQVYGAPEHLAPERIRTGRGDQRSDGYALAAVLYHLCTGVPLFDKPDISDLLRDHLYRPPPALDAQSIAAGVPRDMDALLQRALAKDPADRYATIEQLGADLLRIQRGEPPLALAYYRERTRGGLAAVRRRLASVRANRFAVPAAALLVLALAGGAVLGVRALSSWSAARRGRGRDVDVLAMRALALGVLQDGLRAADTNQRVLAVRALGQSRDPRHREALQGCLADPTPQIRMEAAAALGTLGVRSAAPALLRCAQTASDPPTLLACGEALDRLDIDAAQGLLKKLMAATDQAVAVPAALALEARSDADARKFLDERLASSKLDPAARALVLERRALRGDKAAQAQAEALLADGRPEAAPGPVRLEVAASLVKLDDSRARSALMQTVEGGGPLQVLAAQLLCATDDLFGQPLLRQVLSEPQRPLADRLLATSGLGTCGDREDLRALGQTLQRGEPELTLRQAEAGSLLRLCSNDPSVLSEQSLSVAMAGLRDDSPLWREAAVAALGGTDPQQAVPLLGQALKEDQQPEVRRRAAHALGRTHHAGAMAMLGAAMNDQNRDVRFTVFRSIGEVGSSLRERGDSTVDPALRTRVQSELSARAQSSDPAEQVIASAALLRLGDERHREKLRSGLAAKDREALQAAIEEAAADRELERKSLPQLLNHPDFAVRMQAATALAMAGEHSAVGVLREALSRGEAEAIKAYGLLVRLGESVTLPDRWAEPLSSGQLKTRLATVEAALQLPAALAVDLLSRASHDPDRNVRRRVVELLGDIPLGNQLPVAIALLRRMQNDTDAVVRSLATVVLAQRLPRHSQPVTAERAAGKSTPRSSSDRPDQGQPGRTIGDDGTAGDEPPPAEPTPVVDAGAEPTPAEPEPATGRNDNRAEPQPAETTASRDQTTTIRKSISAGLSALKNNEAGKAQRILEKVNSACARSRGDAAQACAGMAYELSLSLGRVYEAQSQWALAMREYDKLKSGTGSHSATSQQRAEISAALKRLSPKLGRVIIPKIVHKRCQESVVWLPPGTHTVNLRGSTQQVRVRAQETVKVGQCP